MIYLDTSALVKLIVQEAESADLQRWLAQTEDGDYVTSAMGRVELMRTALRIRDPEVVANARRVLDEEIDILAFTDRTIAAVETIGPDSLRSLDAIHLASASQLGEALTAVVAYDQRLIEAGRSLGYPVESPGRPLTPPSR